jgi:hypothetical protein
LIAAGCGVLGGDVNRSTAPTVTRATPLMMPTVDTEAQVLARWFASVAEPSAGQPFG